MAVPKPNSGTVTSWIPSNTSPNFAIPDPAHLAGGWIPDETPPCDWFNYMMNQDTQWLNFVNAILTSNTTSELTGVGDLAFVGATGNSLTGVGSNCGSGSSATESVFFGINAGGSTVGDHHTYMGPSAGFSANYSLANNNIGIGYNAMGNSGATQTIAIGKGAAQWAQGPLNSCVMIGYEVCKKDAALPALLMGSLGVHVGAGAGALSTLVSGTQGSGLVNIGTNAGRRGISNDNSISVGMNAGMDNQGTYSVFIGYLAGRFNTGTDSIAIGQSANEEAVLTNKTNNIAIGSNAHTYKSKAIAIGVDTGRRISFTGTPIIVIGDSAAWDTQGDNSIIIGGTYTGLTGSDSAGYLFNGDESVLIGNSAGANASASNSVFIGSKAGRLATGTSNSVYIGRSAGENINGISNIAIGTAAGSGITGIIKSSSIFIGFDCGNEATTSQGIAMGYRAGVSMNSSGSVAIGAQAPTIGTPNSAGESSSGSYTVMIGPGAGAGSSSANGVSIGRVAGRQSTSQNVTYVGWSAGANTTGDDHTFIGEFAGYQNIGSANIGLGRQAGQQGRGQQGVAIGDFAGVNSWSSGGVYIGTNACGNNSTTVASDCIAIGFQAMYNSSTDNSISANNQRTIAIGYRAGAKTIATGGTPRSSDCIFIGKEQGLDWDDGGDVTIPHPFRVGISKDVQLLEGYMTNDTTAGVFQTKQMLKVIGGLVAPTFLTTRRDEYINWFSGSVDTVGTIIYNANTRTMQAYVLNGSAVGVWVDLHIAVP